MVDKSHQDELDWNTLSNPVPLDLIDPEFPAHPAEPESLPGAASEILPREEPEAESQSPMGRTEEMPAYPGINGTHGNGGPTGYAGNDVADIADEFSRLRAKMEAEAEAEKKAKHDADKEEASQRERLEQWMANARARLLKADADLTGPSGRVRIRKEHSPSLYRLAEMQKTMIVEGDATLAQSPNGTFLSESKGKAAEPPLDPMATISVPADQFLTLDAPAQPTPREQALARQAAQQAKAQQVSHELAAARIVKEAEAAQHAKAIRSDAYPSGEIQMDQIPTVMSREQALTRKVAQLRKVAESSVGSSTAALPGDAPERSALHFAIAAVVVIAIGVLGLGLFAATQAGLFDGLENQIPFLRPKMSLHQIQPKQAIPKSAPTVVPAKPASPSQSAATAQAPVQEPAAPRPASATAPAQGAVKALPVAPKPSKIAPKAPAPRPAAQVRAKKPAPAAAAIAESDDGEIPAYAQAKPKAANLAEIILRASVQAATNIDADNLQEMYSRYALGFPGLSGEVVIGLTVDPGGRVLEGSILSSSTGVDAFDQELLRKVLDWRLRAFPDSRPKFISVPFLFPLQGH